MERYKRAANGSLGGCIPCSRRKTAEYAKTHRVEARNRSTAYRAANLETVRAKGRAYFFCNPEKTMWHRARSRARAKGIAFTISIEDIRIPTKCPVLGIPLSYGTRCQKDAAPSLERIRPALGYVPGNILVISFRANAIKRDATTSELRMLVDFYERLEKMNELDRFLIMRGLAA